MNRSNVSSVDALKVFAMNAQLAETELDRVEREHHLELGRGRVHDKEAEQDYFPQFDEALRAEAAEMSAHYEVFYCLEKTIRVVVAETLEAGEGAGWWDSDRVPDRIKTSVTERIQKEVDSGITIRSSQPIDYTTFGELSELIKSNWDLFGALFNSRRAVERVMANLNLLRGPIAHCSLLAEDEVVRLELSLRDWFRQME